MFILNCTKHSINVYDESDKIDVRRKKYPYGFKIRNTAKPIKVIKPSGLILRNINNIGITSIISNNTLRPKILLGKLPENILKYKDTVLLIVSKKVAAYLYENHLVNYFATPCERIQDQNGKIIGCFSFHYNIYKIDLNTIKSDQIVKLKTNQLWS